MSGLDADDGEAGGPNPGAPAAAGETRATDADAKPEGAPEPEPGSPPAGARADAAPRDAIADAKPLRVLHGNATYYAQSFAGKLTTSEAPYDPKKLTAAMKTLPLGSVVRVTRLDTGGSVVVEVNDRLPKRMGATIDLSRAAAERLHMIEEGIVKTRIEVLSMPEDR